MEILANGREKTEREREREKERERERERERARKVLQLRSRGYNILRCCGPMFPFSF